MSRGEDLVLFARLGKDVGEVGESIIVSKVRESRLAPAQEQALKQAMTAWLEELPRKEEERWVGSIPTRESTILVTYTIVEGELIATSEVFHGLVFMYTGRLKDVRAFEALLGSCRVLR